MVFLCSDLLSFCSLDYHPDLILSRFLSLENANCRKLQHQSIIITILKETPPPKKNKTFQKRCVSPSRDLARPLHFIAATKERRRGEILKRFSVVLLYIVALAALAAWTPEAGAFSDYGGCSDCHGGFRSSPYTSRVDGMSWGDDMHDVHRRTMLSGDCGTCHRDGNNETPVLLNQSQLSNARSDSCVGCHDGPGLREHHRNSGAHTCSGCHSTNETPAGEDVQRPYYEGLSIDPCNPDGSEDFAGSNIGLDNDGDLDYDTGDPDCPECVTNTDCDDQMFCTDDVCNNGICENNPIDCSDGIACTADSCNEANDTCVNTPNDVSCPDDGLFCNGSEFCDQQNDCTSTGNLCGPGEECDEANDQCVAPPECTTDSDCDDGDVCNGAETCANDGTCQSGTLLVCDDENICNGTETCDPVNGCQAGTPLVCDDGQFCTGVETCDPVTGCLDGQNPCPPNDTCDETSDQCLTPECEVDADCDDALFCTGTETCVAGVCQPGTDPCAAGETCEEANDQCVAPPVILDIAGFRVTKRVSLKRPKSVTLKLVVKNGSQYSSTERSATVVGVQNGVEVYNETMGVEAMSSNSRITLLFPGYTPIDPGDILWTATIENETTRAANDAATATTKVVP